MCCTEKSLLVTLLRLFGARGIVPPLLRPCCRFDILHFGTRPSFTRKSFLQKRLWKSRCQVHDLQYAFCSQYCSRARIHRGHLYDCVSYSLFARFWCTLTHVQSKPSGNSALKHQILKYALYKISAYIRRAFCCRPILERLIDVCSWKTQTLSSQHVWKMFGLYVIERYEMQLWQHFCTLLALSLLDFAADPSHCRWIISNLL